MCRIPRTLAALIALLAPHAVGAVVLGQLDDFEDGTTQGWRVAALGSPHPAPPANVATGGPDGDGDAFLLLTSLGSGDAGSRLTAIQSAQWAGDYTTSGVGQIAMVVRNFGATDLSLRLLFQNGEDGAPVDAAFSSVAIPLPAGGGWTSITFPITPGHLSAAFGSVDAALAGATQIRLYHGVANAYPGERIAAQLGVDDVLALPEPDLALLGGLAIALLGALRRNA